MTNARSMNFLKMVEVAELETSFEFATCASQLVQMFLQLFLIMSTFPLHLAVNPAAKLPILCFPFLLLHVETFLSVGER